MSAITEDHAKVSQMNGHERCFMCGDKNPLSLRVAFRDADDGGVKARFRPHKWLQGYDGILHGGVISALLDAAMTNCLFRNGVKAFTADLRVRFVELVSCSSALDLRAWVVRARPPFYRLRADLRSRNRIVAWAEAKFMSRKSS